MYELSPCGVLWRPPCVRTDHSTADGARVRARFPSRCTCSRTGVILKASSAGRSWNPVRPSRRVISRMANRTTTSLWQKRAAPEPRTRFNACERSRMTRSRRRLMLPRTFSRRRYRMLRHLYSCGNERLTDSVVSAFCVAASRRRYVPHGRSTAIGSGGERRDCSIRHRSASRPCSMVALTGSRTCVF